MNPSTRPITGPLARFALALLTACRRGPLLARVDRIEEVLAEPPGQPGFLRLPTG